MNFNVFNSKVNLPLYLEHEGLLGYSCTFVSGFGWYGKKDGVYLTPLQFLFLQEQKTGEPKQEQIKRICATEEICSGKMLYSDESYRLIMQTFNTWCTWSSLYIDSKQHLETSAITYRDKIIANSPALYLQKNGYASLITNGCGYFSHDLREKYMKSLNFIGSRFPKGKRFIVPSYSSPAHIAGLYMYVELDNQEKQVIPLYQNGKGGWMGNHNSNELINSMEELWHRTGVIWDAALDVWTTNTIQLPKKIPPTTAIKLWLEAKHTSFDPHPILAIPELERENALNKHISRLSYKKLKEINDLLGVDLKNKWLTAKERVVTVGKHEYWQENSRYYSMRHDYKIELTNFALNLDNIKKVNNKYVVEGHILYEDNVFPFELDYAYFENEYKFVKAIKRLFLEYGIGLCVINSIYRHLILTVVLSFNESVRITN